MCLCGSLANTRVSSIVLAALLSPRLSPPTCISSMMSTVSTLLQGLLTLVGMSVSKTGPFFHTQKNCIINHSPQTAET